MTHSIDRLTHLCPEMHLTLKLGTSYKTGFLLFSYEFMFDKIMCVLVRIEIKGAPCDTVHESH